MKLILDISQRIFLMLLVLFVSAWIAMPFEIFLKINLGYQGTEGFFGFNISSALLATILTWLFLVLILLNFLGKKIDYILSGLSLLFAFFLFSRAGVTELNIYLTVVVVALIGSVMGYILKLVRLKYFAKN